MLKPAAFKCKKPGDPEQLLQDFTLYKTMMAEFFLATSAAGQHTADCAQCTACPKAKSMVKLIGGTQMVKLFDHVGVVLEGDSYEAAMKKIENGIKSQTNQATARFKLFREMAQGGESFADWWPKVKEQADRCDWANYDVKQACRDALLYQTDDTSLQKKIIAENLSYEDTIKAGTGREQGAKKVERINKQSSEDRVRQLEEDVRSLRAGSKADKVKSCNTCTRPSHPPGKCPGLDKECFECKVTGHFKGSSACKKKKKTKTEKSTKQKVNEVSEEDTEDTDSSVGRVVESGSEKVNAANQQSVKNITTHLKLTALDKGRPSDEVDVELLVDSGVHKTLLSERDWQKLAKGDRKAKIKRCKVNFTPYGTKINLPMLGRTKAILQARSGATLRTIVYVVKGQKQSLLGLKDGQALGIIEINPEGKSEVVRKLEEEKKLPAPVEGEVLSKIFILFHKIILPKASMNIGGVQIKISQ